MMEMRYGELHMKRDHSFNTFVKFSELEISNFKFAITQVKMIFLWHVNNWKKKDITFELIS